MEKVIIDGETYVPESAAMAANLDGMRYCIIRTYSAGVHAGYVASHSGKEVRLISARRLWKWAGAFTLSEMAVSGVTQPGNCKFSITVPEIILTEAVEIIPCTKRAQESIEGVTAYEC